MINLHDMYEISVDGVGIVVHVADALLMFRLAIAPVTDDPIAEMLTDPILLDCEIAI